MGLKFFRGNELRAVARAQRATLQRATSEMTAQSARVHLLAEGDRPELEVTAREAQGDLLSQKAVTRGGTRVAEVGGAAGITESALLDAKAQKVSGQDPVDIVGPGYRIRARKGFALDYQTPGSLALEGPIDTTVGGLR